MGTGKGICINKVLSNGKLEDYLMIPYGGGIASLCFNNDGTLLAVALYDGNILVLDPVDGHCFYSLFFDEWMRALCFDHDGKRLVVGSNPYYTDKIIRIINRYDDFTIDQLMLRTLMELWLQVQKPKKNSKSARTLFKNMAQLFHLDKQELNQVWLTFPEFMRVAITKTMTTRIAKYAKNKKNENCVVS